jgi:HK97 family phage major capsid protein
MSLFAQIQEKKQKRANLVNQARELIERAQDADRDMDTAENEQHRKILADVNKMKDHIDLLEQQYEAEQSVEGVGNQSHRQNPGKQDQGNDNPRASEDYIKSFRNYLLSGNIQNSLQMTDDPSGGFITSPLDFINQLIKDVDDLVFIRQWATKFKTNAKSLGAPSLDADPDDFDWTSEVGTVNEDKSMKFGRRELTPHALSKLIKVSMKLLRSSLQDPEDLVRARMAYKLGLTQEKAFLTGNGVNQPLGVFTASKDGISTNRDVSNGNTATEIQLDGLKAVKWSLKAQYHEKAKWMFHRDGLEQIDKLKDANGQYLWQPSIQVGEPDRLLNFPYYASESVPNVFTTGKYVGMLGDFSNYWIVDSQDFGVQRLVELYAGNNQVGFIGRGETDGMPVKEEAFSRVKLG